MFYQLTHERLMITRIDFTYRCIFTSQVNCILLAQKNINIIRQFLSEITFFLTMLLLLFIQMMGMRNTRRNDILLGWNVNNENCHIITKRNKLSKIHFQMFRNDKVGVVQFQFQKKKALCNLCQIKRYEVLKVRCRSPSLCLFGVNTNIASFYKRKKHFGLGKRNS